MVGSVGLSPTQCSWILRRSMVSSVISRERREHDMLPPRRSDEIRSTPCDLSRLGVYDLYSTHMRQPPAWGWPAASHVRVLRIYVLCMCFVNMWPCICAIRMCECAQIGPIIRAFRNGERWPCAHIRGWHAWNTHVRLGKFEVRVLFSFCFDCDAVGRHRADVGSEPKSINF